MSSKKITYESSYNYYKSIEDLPDDQSKSLCIASQIAIEDAYAEYSKFRVGAAILLENGQIIKGSNQENAVFPLGLCAERVAIFSVASQDPGASIQALAVATEKEVKDGDLPAFPCGSCRQVILDVESRQQNPIRLLVVGSDNSVCEISSVRVILPFAFTKDSL